MGADTAPPNNDVCDTGLAYACGDTGPGTGTVFYASATPFTCGAGMTDSCNFLEVAPNGWNGNLVNCPGSGAGTGLVQSSCGGTPSTTSDWGSDGPGAGKGYQYCTGAEAKKLAPGADATVIGSGFSNTTAIIAKCSSVNAGELARGYNGGGMSDWSLPSKDELNALYNYPNRNQITGFAADDYWSSSQYSDTNAWYQWFTAGLQTHYNNVPSNLGVRPVRAF